MSRNYSDFMRSLAAKYNNSNVNDYRKDSFFSLLDSQCPPQEASGNLSTSSTPVSSALSSIFNLPFGLLNPALANHGTQMNNECSSAAKRKWKKKEKRQDLAALKPLAYPDPITDPNIHFPSIQPDMSSFPMMDMSSTQALLSFVRFATSRNAHIDSYLQETDAPASNASPFKRSAGAGELGAHSPLDLSTPAPKRRCLGPFSDTTGPMRDNSIAKLSDDMEIKETKYSTTANRIFLTRSNSSDKIAFAENLQSEKRESNPTSSSELAALSRLKYEGDSCNPAAIEVRNWSVSDVVDFVKNIDLCEEYAHIFQEHSIDGCSLPLLTEDHLVSSMNMKLGPALKLRSVLAKKIGHCATCLHCAHCHGASVETKVEIPSRPSTQCSSGPEDNV